MLWRTRDTRAMCHKMVAAIKVEHFLRSPCFLNRNGKRKLPKNEFNPKLSVFNF